MVTPVFSILGYIYSLSLLTLLLPGLSQGSPIMSPEELRRGPGARGLVDTSMLEQNEDLDMQDFQGQFLSTLNLTELGPRPRPRAARKEPPEYMLELYNRFANDRTAMPSANIVRSFKNEDSSFYSVTIRGVRTHPLLFNISIPHHEHILTAELRLYTLVQRDRRCYSGLDRKVTIYKIHGGGHWRKEEGRDGRRNEQETDKMEEMEELATRQVYGKDDAWITFDLTHQVNLWRKAESSTHRLEVHIASLGSDGGKTPQVREEDGRKELVDVDVDMGSDGKHMPVVIVFSDDQNRDHREEDKRELNQFTEHENDLLADLEPSPQVNWGDQAGSNARNTDGEELDEETLIQLYSNLIYDTPPRIRRNTKGDPCKKTPLYVEFKDIGWDTWVIQPLGYEAYECNGVCSYPMTSEVSPTKHAIVQSRLSSKIPQKASPACCVPTKLEPIALLYVEDGGVVTYMHKYEGMVVSECGCR
ncbi:bone morphogenetic protein 10 [Salmo salar]|uniref:Bone morphogenetic protein 10 n=1 Tax=Salmo salar TaxID=8030 RepID=A0A1S3LT68_SALSA|nr:bone morphogenetic protein 10-like [Salmo salar]|eukprot:XP_013993754.1 PREDICTED: bone morphogenetic protein 10-like isoform X1 [Salmo salar]